MKDTNGGWQLILHATDRRMSSHPSQAPPCPKCGNQTPEKVSERRGDLSGGFFDKPQGSPKEMIYVFRCHCGTAFAHSVTDNKAQEGAN